MNNHRRFVVGAVLGLGAILAATIIVNLAIGAPPDYADLVPAPDAIIWSENQATTLWLSTNRHDVEMHIDSVALGINEIVRVQPGTGQTQRLGDGIGCQDWVVSSLSGTVTDTGNINTTVTILRDGYTGVASVHIRGRGQEGRRQLSFQAHLSSGITTNTQSWTVDSYPGEWVFEASNSEHFHPAVTRTIIVNTEIEETMRDEDAEVLLLLENTGVTLEACSEHEDVVITLEDGEGSELARYLVDIGPALAAAPVPVLTLSPYAGHTSRRVCADDASDRASYLTGAEKVGAALSASSFGLSGTVTYTISDVVAGAGDVYFVGVSSGGQLTVSDVGADDTRGMDVDRVYEVRVTATNRAGLARYLDVGVWLDTSTLSPNDDGECS